MLEISSFIDLALVLWISLAGLFALAGAITGEWTDFARRAHARAGGVNLRGGHDRRTPPFSLTGHAPPHTP